MASTFFGLNIGKSGLYTYQIGLNTTAHNVTNSGTKGYTRQVIDQSASKPISLGNYAGMAGTGVTVNSIDQIRDSYLDEKFSFNTSLLGEYENKSFYMQELQSYMNEITVTGFTKNFDNFSSALQSLANDPSNNTTRTQVTQYGENLTEYLNSLSKNLQMIQEECNTEVKNQVDKINSIAEQICTLNSQINGVEINGVTANDLRDQRQLLVDELSKYVSVDTEEHIVKNGTGVSSYTVRINGQMLVDSFEYNSLEYVPRKVPANQNDIPGLYNIIWSNTKSNLNTLGDDVSGSLKAVLQMRDGNNNETVTGKVTGAAGDTTVTVTGSLINDIAKLNIANNGTITIDNREYNYDSFQVIDNGDKTYSYKFQLAEGLKEDATAADTYVGNKVEYKGIPYYMSQMNEFVRTYAYRYNTVCRDGIDANGNQGEDFFTSMNDAGTETKFSGDYLKYYTMTCANMTVNTDVSKDLSKVVVSRNIVDGVENKDIVDELIALQSDSSMFKQGTPSAFFQTMVAEVGVLAKTAATLEKNQDDIVKAVTNQRLSISGVDLDEEAMNLVKFKNAYNLSAKVISVMDEVLDRLINYTGV